RVKTSTTTSRPQQRSQREFRCAYCYRKGHNVSRCPDVRELEGKCATLLMTLTTEQTNEVQDLIEEAFRSQCLEEEQTSQILEIKVDIIEEITSTYCEEYTSDVVYLPSYINVSDEPICSKNSQKTQKEEIVSLNINLPGIRTSINDDHEYKVDASCKNILGTSFFLNPKRNLIEIGEKNQAREEEELDQKILLQETVNEINAEKNISKELIELLTIKLHRANVMELNSQITDISNLELRNWNADSTKEMNYVKEIQVKKIENKAFKSYKRSTESNERTQKCHFKSKADIKPDTTNNLECTYKAWKKKVETLKRITK
ncbi:3261_t:CDS:2, partial [Gigaspora rosea]